MEYVLLAVLLLAAVFIVIAVLFQKSTDEGLSGTIAGGNSETYYGKDKSKHTDKLWFKWTLIASLVFAVAVILTYIIQPDYYAAPGVNQWQELTDYAELFK
jgi:protein translocase SecG subunit